MPESPTIKIVRLTPPGRGAVATLLVDGAGAIEAVTAHFQAAGGKPLASYPPGRLVFGHFDFGSEAREEVVIRHRGPESVEIHCHGGQAAVDALEAALVGPDAETVDWKDWAAQHDDDAIAAAARVALADARTERAALVLLDQFNGALRRAFDVIGESLARGERQAAGEQIETLLARAPVGQHLTEPWRVVLAGPPNVGKSSLINALVGYRRAIVHPTPGTTRDLVTATTALDGWPVELIDTAGLHSGGDELERAGIERAEEKLAAADLVVLVFDLNEPWSEAAAAMVADLPDALIVHNKRDLPRAPGSDRPEGVCTSALHGQGIDELIGAIAERLVPCSPSPGAAVPFTSEQIEWLESVVAEL